MTDEAGFSVKNVDANYPLKKGGEGEISNSNRVDICVLTKLSSLLADGC